MGGKCLGLIRTKVEVKLLKVVKEGGGYKAAAGLDQDSSQPE